MSGVAHNLGQEFWRPPEHVASPSEVVPTEICSRCNTQFIIGSRFCHVCGSGREVQDGSSASSLADYLDLHVIRESLGLSIGTLVAFVIGVVCVGAAVATGLMYTATTQLEWQAVQLWRIEWLLASAAAFLAGIALKRNS